MGPAQSSTSERERAVESRSASASVSWAGGEVRLRDARVFGIDVLDSAPCARFLGRVLTLDDVLSVIVDREEATAIIRLVPGAAEGGDPSAFLARLAVAIRGEGVASGPSWAIPAARWSRGTRFSVYRHGGVYSMWGVVYDRPGRLRLRHESLSLNPELGRRIAREIGERGAQVRASASAWTGSLAIDYDPSQLTTTDLIRLAEEALERASAEGAPGPSSTTVATPNSARWPARRESSTSTPSTMPRPSWETLSKEPAPELAADLAAAGAPPEAAALVAAAEVSLVERETSGYGGSQNLELAGASLGIAALGQFAIPALIPVSAALLIGTNLKTFRATWQQARERKLGLPVLSTTIVATTMVSGQFVGAALMSCFTAYWNRRGARDLAEQRRSLLEDCLPVPPLVRLLEGPEDAPEILVPPDQIREGNRIVVVAGDAIPADGTISDGELVVDERSLRGLDGASRKGPGSFVLAGSLVLAGSAKMRVERTGDATRSALIARALTSATSPAKGGSAPTRHAEAFATKTVAPVLATSGLGLLVTGNPVAALAMMRPDYATGVGHSVPLATLRDVATCARRGIVIRDAEAFDKLDQVDTIVIDDHPALRRTALEVAGIETRLPREVEPDLLRYAASALRHLDDPRVPALAAACRERQVPLFDIEPAAIGEHGVGVAIVHGTRRVRVHEADSEVERALADAGISTAPSAVPTSNGQPVKPLLVEINGNLVALISFRPSAAPEGAEAIRHLAASGNGKRSIVLLSDRPRGELAPLAASLGVNRMHAGCDPHAKVELLRSYRQQGRKAAFVGDCSDHAAAPVAAEAFIAISIPRSSEFSAIGTRSISASGKAKGKGKRSHRPMSGSIRSATPDPLHPANGPEHDEAFLLTEPGPASVQLLSDRLDRLDLLWEIADDRSRRIRRDQAIVTVPNVLSVAGAFLFGFTSFHSVILTNLGTYTAYTLAGDRSKPGRAGRLSPMNPGANMLRSLANPQPRSRATP